MTQDKELEEKIAIAQEKVSRLHKPYEAAVEELQDLLNQKSDYRKEQIWDTFVHSDRDYEQVMAFLKTPIGEWDDEEWYL